MAKRIVTLAQDKTSSEVLYRKGNTYYPFTSTELPNVGGGGGGTVDYLVYTALLESPSVPTQTSGSLISGRVYKIITYEDGDNFTNVATVLSGTINTNNCVFLATNTTPTDYSNGSLLATTGALTVFENTIGAIVWTWSDVGVFIGTLSGAFTENKTFILLTVKIGSFPYTVIGKREDGDSVEIYGLNTDGTPMDGASFYIEIRVYS